MTALQDFERHFAACPLVAIIRGVRPEEVIAIGEALLSAGIRIVEIPLNSPEPIESIRRLAAHAGDRALIGAGTVLDPADVARIAEAGGRIIVSPNCSIPVIEATVAAGLVSSPGYFTPSEAFAALGAGAHLLKLFPAEAASPAVLKAQKAILPKRARVAIVGGVTPDTVPGWRAAGADGFGLGGGLYAPGRSPDDVASRARAYVEALAA